MRAEEGKGTTGRMAGTELSRHQGKHVQRPWGRGVPAML